MTMKVPALLIVLASTLFLSLIPPTIVALDPNRISAPVILDTSLGPGSTLTLAINVTGIGPLPEDMDGWQVQAQLDPSVLTIVSVRDGPVLDDVADALGGFALSTTQFNATAGTVQANELLILGTPQPVDLGFTGSGDLVYIDVEVQAYGNSSISFDTAVTILRDVDGTAFIGIDHEVRNGFFANVPVVLPPTASFTIAPDRIFAGTNATFDASSSYDLDGNITDYHWDFGDGFQADEADPIAIHTYTTGGFYNVTLIVTDDDGATDSASREILVGQGNLPPVATFTFTPGNPRVGEPVRFDASASYDPEGRLAQPPDVPFLWRFGDGGTSGGMIVEHTYAREGVYTVTLTVIDERGLRTSTSMDVTVRFVPIHDVAIDNVYVSPSQRRVAGEFATVVVLVENEGTFEETVTVKAFYDGVLIGSQAQSVSPRPAYPYSYVYVPWDTSNVVPGEYTVSAEVEIAADEDLSNNQFTNGQVTILPPPRLDLSPSRGTVGTKVTLTGTGLSEIPYPIGPLRPVLVSFDNQFLGYTFATETEFVFAFNVPEAKAGIHKINVLDVVAPLGMSIDFTVVDETALDVAVDVGSLYFEGDTALATVQVQRNGHLVDPTSIQATLILPDGTTRTLSLRKVEGTTGLYRIEISIAPRNSIGTYNINVEASYHSDYSDSTGYALKSFTVKTVWLSPARVRTTSVIGSLASVGLIGPILFKTYVDRKAKRRGSDMDAPSTGTPATGGDAE